MAYQEYLKYLEEEFKRQQELLGKERQKALEEARRVLGVRGVGATGVGVKELSRIEEAYSRALGQLLSEYSARRTQVRMAEAEERKRRLATILQGILTGAGAVAGLFLGAPQVGAVAGGAVGQAVGQAVGKSNPENPKSNPNSKSKNPSKFKEYAPYLLPELSRVLAGMVSAFTGLPGYESMAYGVAGISEIPYRMMQKELLDLQKQYLLKMIEFYSQYTTPQQIESGGIPPSIEIPEKQLSERLYRG